MPSPDMSAIGVGLMAGIEQGKIDNKRLHGISYMFSYILEYYRFKVFEPTMSLFLRFISI